MQVTLDSLCQKLGYTFKDESLLKTALTHRSVRGENNERLEFLGDSLLNFIITAELYQRFPKATEGELSRLRANLVKGETIASLAQQLEVGHYLRLGVGELKSGGFQRKSILADAFEAIIGALYLDGGLDICRSQVLSWFAQHLTESVFAIAQKDPKTKLQEYLQARRMALPKYEILSIEGEAHAQIFLVECRVEGSLYVTSSIGASRRMAEQEAARKFLELLES